MIIDVISIFPEIFDSVLRTSIIKRAIEKGIVKVRITNLRDFASDKHRTVDEPPYGGGGGMVLKIEPLVKCIKKVRGRRKVRIILLTPSGNMFTEKKAIELSREKNILLVCGHYEGFDDRVSEYVDEELSIGDYVLTGGEIPAMAVIDAVTRLLPGALGNEDSAKNESFMDGLLDYPHYTRPAVFNGKKVPEVLLNGDHKKISEWRKKEALRRTAEKRPDLIKNK